MNNREKVINGLEWLITAYAFDGEEAGWIGDAIALLKTQEPRVLTLEEACGAEECWLERKGNPVTVADLAFNGRTDGYDVDSRELNTLREYVFQSIYYGEYWRCWSARPTDEQMEATSWQG